MVTAGRIAPAMMILNHAPKMGFVFVSFLLMGIFCRVKSAIVNLTGDMLQQWFMRMWEMLLLCWMGVFELNFIFKI
jgi:hypothetical protein